jgi:hypothetical protein
MCVLNCKSGLAHRSKDLFSKGPLFVHRPILPVEGSFANSCKNNLTLPNPSSNCPLNGDLPSVKECLTRCLLSSVLIDSQVLINCCTVGFLLSDSLWRNSFSFLATSFVLSSRAFSSEV